MEQMTLFDHQENLIPLASRVRPDSLEGFVGQEHLLGPGKILRRLIEQDQISSMIFWGPPGVGKTTLASIIAGRTQAEFINFSAVTSGIKEIKEVMRQAEERSRELKRSANEYCEDALRRTEEAVAEAYDEIKKSRARFRAAASATAAGSPSGGRAAYDAAAEED